jgi:hypothetical protein
MTHVDVRLGHPCPVHLLVLTTLLAQFFFSRVASVKVRTLAGQALGFRAHLHQHVGVRVQCWCSSHGTALDATVGKRTPQTLKHTTTNPHAHQHNLHSHT